MAEAYRIVWRGGAAVLRRVGAALREPLGVEHTVSPVCTQSLHGWEIHSYVYNCVCMYVCMYICI